MGLLSRPLLLVGALGLALSVLLPWVTVKGLGLKLGPIGAEVSPGSRTVTGLETSLWPLILGVAAVVAILALLHVAHKLLLALGLVVVAGGGALLYYLSNVVEIESSGGSEIEKLVAKALISSSAGPGTPLMIASGVAIVAGAVLARS
jgi:hypothetical protein